MLDELCAQAQAQAHPDLAALSQEHTETCRRPESASLVTLMSC